jgi:hypothetical protein
MRNLKLIDAVVQLRDIAILVATETEGDNNIARIIDLCAEALHKYSLDEGRASNVADEIIAQVRRL